MPKPPQSKQQKFLAAKKREKDERRKGPTNRAYHEYSKMGRKAAKNC